MQVHSGLLLMKLGLEAIIQDFYFDTVLRIANLICVQDVSPPNCLVHHLPGRGYGSSRKLGGRAQWRSPVCLRARTWTPAGLRRPVSRTTARGAARRRRPPACRRQPRPLQQTQTLYLHYTDTPALHNFFFNQSYKNLYTNDQSAKSEQTDTIKKFKFAKHYHVRKFLSDGKYDNPITRLK